MTRVDLKPAELAFLQITFDLARDRPRAVLTRGADHSRTNDRGQTALGAAVFRRSTEGVRALIDARADPDVGSPSAPDVAVFFKLPEMAALLERSA